MKRLLLFIFVLLLFKAEAQEKGIIGIGISGGAMNYLGDIDDDLTLIFTKPGFGIHLSILPKTNLNFSLNYLHGMLACDDAKGDISRNKYRNLNFYTNIDEISLLTIYRFQKKRGKNYIDRDKVIPYLFAGVACFHFNPKTKLNGVEYELQKIGTEGQYLSNSSTPNGSYPKPYNLWQINIPFGGGAKMRIFPAMDLGIEIGFRKTFTDYLDDLSGIYPDKDELLTEQGEIAYYLSDPSNDPSRPDGRKNFSPRGHPDRKDWYIYSNINITYYFTTKLFKARQRFDNV